MKAFLVLILLFLTCCQQRWGYDLKNGPDFWGTKDRKDRFCHFGNNQSPINLGLWFGDNELKFFYEDVEFEKIEDLYELKFLAHNRTFIKRGRKKYFVRYFKFRHPSEHFVDSKPYSLEMQIIHKSDDEQFLASVLFFELSDNDEDNESRVVNDILDFISLKKKEVNINLQDLFKGQDQNFYYDGSFTSPPCKEGLKWYVFSQPIYISKRQMKIIIDEAIFVPSNARNIQEFHPDKY